MTKPMPPMHFFMTVEDPRLQQLIVQVWRRLPPHDRAVLRELVEEANDYVEEEDVAGSAGDALPSMVYNGNAGDVAEDQYLVVRLGGCKSIVSDEACRFVIAHEFAHVVLRHSQISTVMGTLKVCDPPFYSDEETEQLKRWHEEEADLQCWVWGFKDEMRAFAAEHPDVPQPRWFQDITTERVSWPSDHVQEREGATDAVIGDP